MYKKIQIFTLTLFILCLVCVSSLFSIKVLADSSEGDVGFSVFAQLPENQLDSGVSYFDLHMEPGSEQILEVIVTNTSPDPIEIDVMAITASTNRNGIIDYKTPGIQDSSMKIAFSDIATPTENTLQISGNASQVAKIQLAMPEESYDGVILGGLLFQKSLTPSEVSSVESEGEGGTIIQNRYNYIIGVELSETDVQISPDFEMVSAAPTLTNYQKSITSTIRNKSPMIIKDMQISAKISQEGQTEVLLENAIENANMAPNSVFPFPVELGDSELNPGKYVSRVHLEWEGQVWDFEMPFEISGEEVSSWAEEAVSDKSSSMPTWAYILIGLAILIVVLLLVILFFIFKKKREQQEGRNE